MDIWQLRQEMSRGKPCPMPEGDTLHRIANALRPKLLGKSIIQIELPRVAASTENLLGQCIKRVEAHGKYLIIQFHAPIALITHLQMTGSWHLYMPGQPWRRPRYSLRALIAVKDAEAVCFSAPTVKLVPHSALKRLFSPASIGPDILAPTFDLDNAVARLVHPPHLPLGVALLDQTRIAGIGNVFKSEMCFRIGLSPLASVAQCRPAELARLISATRTVMQYNVSLPAPTDIDVELMPVAHYFYTRTTVLRTPSPGSAIESGSPGAHVPIAVYRRRGKPCVVCRIRIQMTRQGTQNRSTYYCPHCQPQLNIES